MSYHFGMRKSTEKYLFIFLYHIFNLYWSQFHPHSKSPLFSAVKKLISYKSFLIAFSTIGPFQLEKKLPIEFECIEYALMEFCSYNRNRKRKMSVTISTCNQICNAPTNQSSAKMLYSFPKQSRFLKRKTLLYLCSHPAAIASMISRAPSLLVELASAMDINMTTHLILAYFFLTSRTDVLGLFAEVHKYLIHLDLMQELSIDYQSTYSSKIKIIVWQEMLTHCPPGSTCPPLPLPSSNRIHLGRGSCQDQEWTC